MRSHKNNLSLVCVLFFLGVLSINGAIPSSTDPTDNLKKINTVNLLLPLIQDNLSTRTIQYVLKGYNGCYEWSSSHESVLKVQGYSESGNNCHDHALVTLASNKPFNNIVWINAVDKETGDVLRCESRVAKIHRVEILTKLRTIDAGDTEIFEVLGYDSEGNAFSTLEGVRFRWAITTGGENLKILSLKDSHIKTTEIRRRLESANHQTDIIAAEGLRTGKAKVLVTVEEKDYTDKTHSVIISVIEHFVIFPDTELYVLPYTKVQFSLAILKSERGHKKAHRVTLPSSHYEWINEDPKLAVINNDGSLQCLALPGPVHIKVNDTHTADNYKENTVNIVKPDRLEIQIKEYTEDSWESFEIENILDRKNGIKFENIWKLINGREYYVRVFLYDSARNQIQITNNANIKFAFDSQYIEIIKQKNHELHIRTKNLVINSVLTASLNDITSDKGVYIPERPIKSAQEYSIYSPVAIVRPAASLHLPLLEGISSVDQQTFKAYAIGGTGNYEWVSRDLEIANIGKEAVLVPKKVGKTIIEVRDTLNNKNMDFIEVEISNIRELTFLEKLRETLTQQTGYVNVYATGGENNRKYSNCSFLAVALEIENPTIVSQLSEDLSYEGYLKYLSEIHDNNNIYKQLLENSVQSEYLKVDRYERYIKENPTNKDKIEQILRLYRNYGMCSRSAFKGEFQGETTVKIGRSNQKGILQESRPDELILRVYDPFSTVDPILTYKTSGERQVILSFLSSFTWNLQGGPSKWDTRELSTSIKVVPYKANSPQLKHSKLASGPAQASFEILCPGPPTEAEKSYPYTVNLTSQNAADYRLPDPVRVESNIKVACKVPSSIEIYIIAQDEKNLDTNRVHNLVRESYTIRRNQYYNFQTWVFDEQNAPFYNFSSLAIRWDLDPASSGSLERADPSILSGKNSLLEDQFKRLILTASEGQTIYLNAKTNDYKAILNRVDSFSEIHDRVTITIKGNIDLDPDHYVLYNHPENSFDIKIKEGSGDFSVSVNATGIVRYNYNRATQTITVYPEALGYVRVIVKDNKLVSSQAATCDIIVANPARIRLDSDTPLLEENTQTTMRVSVYDVDDNRFDADNLRLMNVNLDTSADRNYALKITPQKDQPNRFTVEGRLVGDYAFIASASISIEGKIREIRRIQSNSVNLYVFSRLQAQPSKIVLAPGCISAIKIIGGPTELLRGTYNIELVPTRTSTIDLKTQDSSVFSVKGNHVGEETVTFEVRYRDSGVTLTQVTVPVKVGRITGVEILSVSERKIHIGAQTRLIAGMKVDNEIFRFGLCPFEFTWSSKHDQVLHIHTPSASSIPCTEIGELIHQKDFYLKDYNLAVNATALSVGTAQIELHVKSESHISALQSHHLSAKANIHVINPITTDIPTYIGVPTRIALTRNEIIAYGGVPTCTDLPPAHPTLLVLPPNVRYQIKTNYPDNQLRYTLSDTDSKRAYVSETGEVSTLFDKGKVTVIVEDINTNAELMMLNILITNVYSIFVENSYQAFNLPPGSDTSLEIHLQDSLGRSFPSPKDLKGLSLTFYTSNAQVLEGKLTDSNSKLQLTAKAEGVALCSVYLTDNPLVFDTFLVMVGTVVTPASPVFIHEGGNINFAISSSLVQASGRSHWSSDDTSVVDIDNRGRARAYKQGETNIRFSDSVQYTTKVHVVKANRIELDAPISELTNIPSKAPAKGEYRIPLRIFSDNNQITSFSAKNLPIDNNLEVKCRAIPHGWVEARTEIVTDERHKQVPVCVLTFEPSYPTNKAVPNTITLEVTVDTKDLSLRSSYSKQFSFEFRAAFKILDLDKKTLVLNKKNPSATIPVHTSIGLTVASHEDKIDRLSADASRIDRNGIANIHVSVKPEDKKISTSFDIISDLGQRETIHVYYEPDAYITPSRKNPLSGLNLSLLDMILLIIVVVVVIILIVSMKNLSGRNVSVAPQQPINPVSGGSYLGGGTAYRNYLNTSTQSNILSRPGESFLSHRDVSGADGSRLYR